MKIEIMSGQPAIDLNEYFHNLLTENGYNEDTQLNVMMYPERCVYQPKELYDSVKAKVEETFKHHKDLFILTYSDHVLNAVRVVIKNHGFLNGKVHQITKDGKDVIANISSNGKLDVWLNDVFDVWDQALDMLI